MSLWHDTSCSSSKRTDIVSRLICSLHIYAEHSVTVPGRRVRTHRMKQCAAAGGSANRFYQHAVRSKKKYAIHASINIKYEHLGKIKSMTDLGAALQSKTFFLGAKAKSLTTFFKENASGL